MPVTCEARYLSGVDRGKHVSLLVPGGKYTGPWELEGKLVRVTHWEDGTVSLHVIRDDGPKAGTDIPADTVVTTTGKPS